ncbi:hypothetical protein INH39_02920 [Massilia violaceinigra]|uniref:Uncharacterized protein n=1 Tax=Massilia violaceinigra TaxID=2045208 RepID=A0ABY4A9S0_9BURK|nr:hypothetical protein [Massilia violaceinigra]UOD30714.1 hypothetical protein INH39_02920 [Massilia violaceinigra]
MNFTDLIGKAPAVLVAPQDIVVITIERYLTGQQLAAIQGYMQKRFPNNRVLVLQKGMTVEVLTAAAAEAQSALAQAGTAPSGAVPVGLL